MNGVFIRNPADEDRLLGMDPSFGIFKESGAGVTAVDLYRVLVAACHEYETPVRSDVEIAGMFARILKYNVDLSKKLWTLKHDMLAASGKKEI